MLGLVPWLEHSNGHAWTMAQSRCHQSTRRRNDVSRVAPHVQQWVGAAWFERGWVQSHGVRCRLLHATVSNREFYERGAVCPWREDLVDEYFLEHANKRPSIHPATRTCTWQRIFMHVRCMREKRMPIVCSEGEKKKKEEKNMLYFESKQDTM